ncbi:MAG: L,D-transpeptidase family protein [Niabella sp.]
MGKLLALSFVCFVLCTGMYAQQTGTSASYSGGSFIDYQKTFQRPKESFTKKEALLKTLFELKGLTWPSKYLYVRSFKYDSQLEVWAKNTMKEPYKLVKMYKVCALAGTLGPKRFEGDYQVPEGFYYINHFNPTSSYYLSLGLNYPNASDRILSDQNSPGGAIYIHGGCATVGCIPIKDDQIDELYILAASAKSAGQDFIPVHVFPIKFDVKRSYEYLGRLTKDDPALKAFSIKMEQAYDYFDEYKQLPIAMVKDNGEYEIFGAKAVAERFVPKPRIKSKYTKIERKVDFVADAVAKWPEYPGGISEYENFLKKLGADMVAFLPENVTKASAQVEYIIDADGAPVNFKVLKGVDEFFDHELIGQIQKMPKWTPAIYREKPVAKKMVQTILIGIE